MSEAWKSRPEGGNRIVLGLMIRLIRLLGRRATKVILVPVAAYFLIMRPLERRASREYLRRVLKQRVSLRHVFSHFLTFAQVTADRVLFLAGEAHKIPVAKYDSRLLSELSQRKTGGVFLAAHLGSFEAARCIAADVTGINVRMVLDRAVNAKFIDTLESFSPGFADSIIDANQPGSQLGLQLAETVQAGKWVGFLADRFMPGDRVTECRFMGSVARFPLGPFIVAAVLRVPVVCVFPLYIDGVYQLHSELLADPVNIPREGRDRHLQQLAQSYAGRLEYFVNKAPYNWFNFFDFWRPSS